MVQISVKHVFSQPELLQKSQQIALLIGDIEHEKAEKKSVAAEYKNKIDKLEAEAKLISGHINNGYTIVDKPAELWLDYANNERVYIDKYSGDELKRESFHASDYQKKIDFDEEQEHINGIVSENGAAHDFANGEMGYDANGNLTDIQANIVTPLDPLGKVIENKKKSPTKAKNKSEKPKPAGNLPDDYGKDFEPELPGEEGDDIFGDAVDDELPM